MLSDYTWLFLIPRPTLPAFPLLPINSLLVLLKPVPPPPQSPPLAGALHKPVPSSLSLLKMLPAFRPFLSLFLTLELVSWAVVYASQHSALRIEDHN